MKTYRQREKQGSKVQESTKGPDEAKIKVKLDLGSCNEVKCNYEISALEIFISLDGSGLGGGTGIFLA